MVYQYILKPFLFLFPPERAHHLALTFLKILLAIPWVGRWYSMRHFVNDKLLEREVFGLRFPNPVGLAAGFDKDGKHFETMKHLGFGFIEIGTVTPRAQIGNPQPRLFRLTDDKALINRMGFNNEGVQALAERLRSAGTSNVIIGGNIGKNKDTPNDQAIRDYEMCFHQLYPFVDYFVVNVSSPNTPGLRALQDKEPLTRLLGHLQKINRLKSIPKPVLLKIAPDLNNDQLDDILEIVKLTKIAGIIATNTTISRNGLRSEDELIQQIGAGGLSGSPLQQRANEIIRYIHQHSNGQLPIIGVGGIMNPADAIEKLAAGATLIQVYTGLIYHGPSLIKKINEAILRSALEQSMSSTGVQEKL